MELLTKSLANLEEGEVRVRVGARVGVRIELG